MLGLYWIERLRLEEKIRDLPRGYISKKIINNVERYYLQWNDNGKTRSQYIKEGQLEKTKKGIETRKQLELELKKVIKLLPKNIMQNSDYTTNVIKSDDLKLMADKVKIEQT